MLLEESGHAQNTISTRQTHLAVFTIEYSFYFHFFMDCSSPLRSCSKQEEQEENHSSKFEMNLFHGIGGAKQINVLCGIS